MTGTDSLLPAYTPSSGGETPPPGGMRGEAADNPHLERPEFRREVVVEEARVITVEEASGTAFAEASGAVERAAPAPEPIAIVPLPAPEPQGWAEPLATAPLWQRPLPLIAAFAGGVLLAMLSGSARRSRSAAAGDDAQELPAAQDG